MRPLEWVVLAIIILAIFGPKTLQSIAHGAGKGAAQAKNMKDELMNDLSLNDSSKAASSDKKPSIPRNSREVVDMLLSSDEKKTSTSQQTGSSKNES